MLFEAPLFGLVMSLVQWFALRPIRDLGVSSVAMAVVACTLLSLPAGFIGYTVGTSPGVSPYIGLFAEYGMFGFALDVSRFSLLDSGRVGRTLWIITQTIGAGLYRSIWGVTAVYIAYIMNSSPLNFFDLPMLAVTTAGAIAGLGYGLLTGIPFIDGFRTMSGHPIRTTKRASRTTTT